MRIGLLTVSNSCSRGTAEDHSGQNLRTLIEGGHLVSGSVEVQEIVPDDHDAIKAILLEWSECKHLDVIVTIGGTGCSPQDVTPEATRAVIDKEIPGIPLAMIVRSLKITPMAMLSRPVCGVHAKTLIINLPGSKKASQECFEVVAPSLRHAVDLIHDNHSHVSSTHAIVQAGHRQASLSGHGTVSPMGRVSRRTVSESSPLTPDSHGHQRRDSHSEHESISFVPEAVDAEAAREHHTTPYHFPSHHHPPHHHHEHHHHRHSHHHSGDHHDVISSVDDSMVARRPRQSPYPMISVDEAVHCVLSEASVLGEEVITFTDGLHRVLAEDIIAADPLPPFRASIKDGYAVIASDGAGSRKVIGDTTAGLLSCSDVTPGHCVRVSTGAPIPHGADAIVQVEDTQLLQSSVDGKVELEVNILQAPTRGQDIRQVGSDIEKGKRVLHLGQTLSPSDLGLLATVGATQIKVNRLPKVGIMSTGNELVEPTAALEPGKIRDSNRVMLMAALREHGFETVDLGIACDTPDSLLVRMRSAFDKLDVVITSGGVSMSEKDLVRDVLIKDLQAKVHFGRVNMKPGKPTTFATLTFNSQKKLFFGLPGNPVSAIVTCNLYVLPALRKMCGDQNPTGVVVKARLDSDLQLDSRPEYHRCVLDWSTSDDIPLARSTGKQLSSRLLSMRSANALLVLPSSSEKHAANRGETMNAVVIGRL